MALHKTSKKPKSLTLDYFLEDHFDSMYNKFITKFNCTPYEYQKKVFKIYYSSPKGILLIAPTGAGKTTLAEFAVFCATENKKKTIILEPFKAITTQITETFQSLGYNAQRYTGDDTEKQRKEKQSVLPHFDILISTNETIFSIFKHPAKVKLLFSNVDVIIIDEIHLVHEDKRGIILEMLLMYIKDFLPQIKIVGLSATLSNGEEFARWLGIEFFTTDFRPVPLFEHFIKTAFFDLNEQYGRSNDIGAKSDKLFGLLGETLSSRSKIIIFASSKKLQDKLRDQLLEILECNVLIHNADLSEKKRKEVELEFKTSDSCVLISTTTLSAGVNLPADVVILFDTKIYKYEPFREVIGWDYLESFIFLQMIGRAGRKGFVERGDYYIFGPQSDLDHVQEIIQSLPAIESKLLKYPALAILYAVYFGYTTLNAISKYLEKSFAYFQSQFKEKYKQDILAIIEKLLNPPYFLTKDSDNYSLTIIGKTCVTLQADPLFFQHIYNTMDHDFTFSPSEVTNPDFNSKFWNLMIKLMGLTNEPCKPLHFVFSTCPICKIVPTYLPDKEQKGNLLKSQFTRFWSIYKLTEKFNSFTNKDEIEWEGLLFARQLETTILERYEVELLLLEGIGGKRLQALLDANLTLESISHMTPQNLTALLQGNTDKGNKPLFPKKVIEKIIISSKALMTRFAPYLTKNRPNLSTR